MPADPHGILREAHKQQEKHYKAIDDCVEEIQVLKIIAKYLYELTSR